jgi:ABC-type phosphate/phosphonate transport system ATPase subunit
MAETTAAAFGLFDREDDLRLMTAVLTGGGRAVAVGEPGVGKSSLLRVADQVAQPGAAGCCRSLRPSSNAGFRSRDSQS